MSNKMEINETFFYLDGSRIIRGQVERIEVGNGFTVCHIKDVLSGEVSVKFKHELFESVQCVLKTLEREFTGRMKGWVPK